MLSLETGRSCSRTLSLLASNWVTSWTLAGSSMATSASICGGEGGGGEGAITGVRRWAEGYSGEKNRQRDGTGHHNPQWYPSPEPQHTPTIPPLSGARFEIVGKTRKTTKKGKCPRDEEITREKNKGGRRKKRRETSSVLKKRKVFFGWRVRLLEPLQDPPRATAYLQQRASCTRASFFRSVIPHEVHPPPDLFGPCVWVSTHFPPGLKTKPGWILRGCCGKERGLLEGAKGSGKEVRRCGEDLREVVLHHVADDAVLVVEGRATCGGRTRRRPRQKGIRVRNGPVAVNAQSHSHGA